MTTMSTRIVPQRAQQRTRRRRSWVGWAFVGPFMLAFLLVLVAPLVYTVYLSLFQHRLIGGNTFVGLTNYLQQLTNPDFWDALLRVSLYLIVFVPVMLGLALLAALAIDSARLHAPRLFRLAIFLPYAVPGVVAALLWGYMYGTQFGLVGNIDRFLGITLPDPLSSNLVLASIGNIMVWLTMGYNMLVFYSALRVVPTELYEAADLDGAGAWRVIGSIKLPAIRPAVAVTLVFSTIAAFQLFNEPNILKSLAPNVISSHFTPNMYAYNLSFAGQQFNSSATVAIVMGVITMVVAYVIQRVASRKA
ncbi:sugar ABC transporter permease [Leifsonia shinshuensis]|uniref:carbohydrate ABC transporter permease n=1 Tax=Leifsonia shinshuensis TaxID=150026 RepID=UPI0028669E1A|nr:sugar ABC transporter permease [Leifsonia shinshuensis]MDR6972683.1 multiple sugar transport system permease protein [Leifsonia shinshuensis]